MQVSAYKFVVSYLCADNFGIGHQGPLSSLQTRPSARRFVNPRPNRALQVTPLARPGTWRFYTVVACRRLPRFTRLPAAQLTLCVGPSSVRIAHAGHTRHSAQPDIPHSRTFRTVGQSNISSRKAVVNPQPVKPSM